MREKVLGLPVDILTKEESFATIKEWMRVGIKKPKTIVTAYSEFFVNAKRDKEFAKIISKASLVTPDGKSVLAAYKYLKISKDKNILQKVLCGLAVGGEILSGSIGESVTGVWLFDTITKNASKYNWRVFILGGWGELSAEVTRMLLERFPSIKIAYDAGEPSVGTDPVIDKRVVDKINNFKPDFLFVQYRPIVQEKWIDSHLSSLKVKVAMGIGGTMDEYAGRLAAAPAWMESHGLKWLWRLIIQPHRWKRMIDAVIVFPWLVFSDSLKVDRRS